MANAATLPDQFQPIVVPTEVELYKRLDELLRETKIVRTLIRTRRSLAPPRSMPPQTADGSIRTTSSRPTGRG